MSSGSGRGTRRKATRGVNGHGEIIAKEGRGIRTFKEYVGESEIMGILLDCFLVRNVVWLSSERVIEGDASQFANLPEV
jgi:hypothetical protein